MASFESNSGIVSSYVFSRNRRKWNAQFTISDSTYISNIESFWTDDTEGGTLPFILVEQPTTAPQAFYWMQMENPELTGPISEYQERNFAFSAKEKGPNYYTDE
jgi:chitodextrinase